MTARISPWWTATALLTGLVLALSVFTFTNSAFAGTGSASVSVPTSPPGVVSPPGQWSPPGEFSPPDRFLDIGVEIDKTVLNKRSNRVDITFSYDCTTDGTPGSESAPLPKTQLEFYASISQARGRDDVWAEAQGDLQTTCKRGKSRGSATVTVTGPDRFRQGPVLASVSVNSPFSTTAVTYFFGYDVEAIQLNRR